MECEGTSLSLGKEPGPSCRALDSVGQLWQLLHSNYPARTTSANKSTSTLRFVFFFFKKNQPSPALFTSQDFKALSSCPLQPLFFPNPHVRGTQRMRGSCGSPLGVTHPSLGTAGTGALPAPISAAIPSPRDSVQEQLPGAWIFPWDLTPARIPTGPGLWGGICQQGPGEEPGLERGRARARGNRWAGVNESPESSLG